MPLLDGIIYLVTFSNEPGNYRPSSSGKSTSLLEGSASHVCRLVYIYNSQWKYFSEEDFMMRQLGINTWEIIQPIQLPSVFLLHGNALTFLKIDTPKITSVKALAPSPRFCDHVSPVPNVNFDWENYKQKQTPNRKQTEKPQTTITK